MSYSANKYNYATPLSSSTELLNETGYATDIKYFTLSDNVLDGSCYPITGDVGLWNSALANSNGTLGSSFVVTVEKDLTVNAVRVYSSQYCYPVAFTIKFYNGSNLIYTVTETANAKVEYVKKLPYTLYVTKYVIEVTKVSSDTSPLRIFNAYNPGYVLRSDNVVLKADADSEMSFLFELKSYDTFKPKAIGSSLATNRMIRTDSLMLDHSSNLTTHNQVKVHDSIKSNVSGVDLIHNTIRITDDVLRINNTHESRIRNTISTSTDRLAIEQYEKHSHLVTTASSDSLHVTDKYDRIFGSTTKTTDAIKIKYDSDVKILNTLNVAKDVLKIKQNGLSHILNTLGITHDILKCATDEKRAHVILYLGITSDTLLVRQEELHIPNNVHAIMKRPSRHIFGKVYVTYTDPMLDSETTTVVTSSEAYNSNKDQVIDGVTKVDNINYFTLYDNNLTGAYAVNNEEDQVGWVSKELSDENGYFSKAPILSMLFLSRPIVNLVVTFDASRNNIVKDFTVTLKKDDGSTVVKEYTNNEETQVTIVGPGDTGISNVVEITVTIKRVAMPNSPAIILDMPISSTLLYEGYRGNSELISIDLLEELTYEDEIEALGGMSANETTIVFDNSFRKFFFNSDSLESKQLKRNRKIVPYLGVEIAPGYIEWHSLGTFWSYKWDVPANGLTTTVVGFDTIGLLDNAQFVEHFVQKDKSIGELIDYVLTDAKKIITFLEWSIDETLYDVKIPYAWFERSSHAAALRRISKCYPMHIYCDRHGVIQAKPQKLRLSEHYDVWSDNTNVISKDYSSLYTVLPNIVSVQVISPSIKSNEKLVEDTTMFTIKGTEEKNLNFSAPYVSDLILDIVCDASVSYTYSVYSWGVSINFTGTGNVSSITCHGTCVDTSTKATVIKQDTQGVRLNGAVTRNVESEFIQTKELANLIIDRLFNLSENDKYDVKVEYRGDIALTINDPILLNDGIAPDNRYNIKRHELSWNGYLTGSADLNT